MTGENFGVELKENRKYGEFYDRQGLLADGIRRLIDEGSSLDQIHLIFSLDTEIVGELDKFTNEEGVNDIIRKIGEILKMNDRVQKRRSIAGLIGGMRQYLNEEH